jgi:hypothetical protein
MRTQAELDDLLLGYRGPQRPLWPLPYVGRPTLRVMLPDGSQTTLPGTDWASLDAWMISADSSKPPPVSFRHLTRKDANPRLADWHDLGADRRPYGYRAFGMFFGDELIAIATSGSTVSASVDQALGLTRLNVIELTRLCKSPDPKADNVLRAVLRIWREFLATTWPPANRAATTPEALITYSLPNKGEGATYRFDGWYRLRECKPWAGGGTRPSASRDSGVRPQALWGWPLTPQMKAAFRKRTRELAEARSLTGAP